MAMKKVLVFTPTYNERDNVVPLFERLSRLSPKFKFDVLFLDDNSPDGTGRLIDALAEKHPNIKVIHRTGKQGIGSAHKIGIAWAYEQGYETLITMDADFTHPPEDIVKFLTGDTKSDVIVGSRYHSSDTLEGWHPFRKLLTRSAHLMTWALLGLEYDCTGAFRLYRLRRIPKEQFELVKSNGYSFFFESLYVLHSQGNRISEIPISPPPRAAGSSKMNSAEIVNSVRQLFKLSAYRFRSRDRFFNQSTLSH